MSRCLDIEPWAARPVVTFANAFTGEHEESSTVSRILVTGGSGFIGTNVVEYYRTHGHEVINVDIAKPRYAAHQAYWNNLDVTNGQALETLMFEFRPEYVFHMAARTDLEGDDVSQYRVNTLGVTNMLAAATRNSPKRIVFASSMLVCALGHRPREENDYSPPNTYGQSKVIAEKQIRNVPVNQLPWIIVRPTSIWGPWFGVPYRNFFDAVRRGYYIHPSSSLVRRTFGFVGNTVYQFDRLIRADSSRTLGRTFYLGDYEAAEIGFWADLIRKEFGSPPIKRVPLVLMRLSAVVGDVLKKCGLAKVPLTSARLRNLLTEAVYDLEDLRIICGDLPFDLEAGVRLTVAWLRDTEKARSEIGRM